MEKKEKAAPAASKSVGAIDLKKLRALGGFVSEKGVRKEVTWENADGEEFVFDIFVKRQSFGAIERMGLTSQQEGDRASMCTFISESVFLDEDCKSAMSFQDAYKLELSLARALINAVSEVNTRPKKA